MSELNPILVFLNYLPKIRKIRFSITTNEMILNSVQTNSCKKIIFKVALFFFWVFLAKQKVVTSENKFICWTVVSWMYSHPLDKGKRGAQRCTEGFGGQKIDEKVQWNAIISETLNSTQVVYRCGLVPSDQVKDLQLNTLLKNRRSQKEAKKEGDLKDYRTFN